MKLYYVFCDEFSTYFLRKKEACKFAREQSAISAADSFCALSFDVELCDIGKVTKEKIIAILNGSGYVENREVIATFLFGKKV